VYVEENLLALAIKAAQGKKLPWARLAQHWRNAFGRHKATIIRSGVCYSTRNKGDESFGKGQGNGRTSFARAGRP